MGKGFRLIAIYLIGCCSLLLSCQQKSAPPEKKKTVLVSVAPYAFFVKAIAEDRVQVKILVPEGANPHTYEPKPQEVQDMQNAALWIRLGEAAEEKVYQVLSKRSPKPVILDVTEGLALLTIDAHDHHEGHQHPETKDRHVWLSPKLAIRQVYSIGHALENLDEESAPLYRANTEKLVAKLEALHIEIASLFEKSPVKAFLVSHPAFAYFCKEYHLTEYPIESEGKEPRPREIAALIEQIKDAGLTTLFLEPQHSTKGALLIAEKLHLQTVFLDPYSGDYLENLKELAHQIAESGPHANASH